MESLREKLLFLEETIEALEIKIARKEKWIHSGLLMEHKDLEQRFAAEAEQLKKEQVIAEKERKDVIMKMKKHDEK